MIHIACNIDSNYVQHCSVTLVSLFVNNPNEEFTIHILANDVTPNEKEILERIATRYNNQIIYYPINLELLKGFSIRKFSKRISIATYYRCILSEILPRDIQRLIYLDCDIIILGALRPFWNISMDNIGVVAVEDVGCYDPKRYDILKYPKEDSYFNAGVLLINMEYWREHNVAQACIDYFHKYPERILYNDQDLLNSILHKNKLLTDLQWNVQDGFYRRPKNMNDAWKQKYAEVLKHPIILHYTNRKPWKYDSQHPLRKEYNKYLDLTPWKGQYASNSFINQLKRFFRLFPFYIKLRKPKYVNLKDL
ncbi:glycosyltransferase family 8 protein [uncultured Bacteroides sp.]|uniref:glycosyltransferase family 8 protein n=1 Tax=uncultured Bacteroides sp. TaxID=162156 RepID=UPI00262D138D|nr:glycosyltransferase family 8 protein [uncultured Bacteroides sp.]